MRALQLLLLISISVCLIASCGGKTDTAAAEKESYEQARARLEEKEKKNPGLFIKVTSKNKRNLIGQTVIRGDLSNEAKVCTYKDVELELSFFSKTGVLLEKDPETIYEVIAPGKTVAFKTKYYAPKDTDSVAIRVLNAKAGK